MGSWSELPSDGLEEVAQKLGHHEVVATALFGEPSSAS
jgi:hypothetical protein